MTDADYAELGLRAGLEIHQQLSTEKKLFADALLEIIILNMMQKFFVICVQLCLSWENMTELL